MSTHVNSVFSPSQLGGGAEGGAVDIDKDLIRVFPLLWMQGSGAVSKLCQWIK